MFHRRGLKILQSDYSIDPPGRYTQRGTPSPWVHNICCLPSSTRGPRQPIREPGHEWLSGCTRCAKHRRSTISPRGVKTTGSIFVTRSRCFCLLLNAFVCFCLLSLACVCFCLLVLASARDPDSGLRTRGSGLGTRASRLGTINRDSGIRPRDT